VPYIAVHDLAMYYEIHGTGEPLVLVLGLGSDVSQYSWMIEELARHYRTIAFDNRGAGRTGMPTQSYSITQMTDDLAGLLEELAIDPARILGISLGSRIAVDLAVRYPNRVKDLILVSVLARRVVGQRISLPLRLSFIARWLPGFRPRFRQPWYAFVNQHAAALDYDSVGCAAEIEVPTLILHGRRDRTASHQGAEEIAHAAARSRLVSFTGGHSFFRGNEQDAFFQEIFNGAKITQ